jgi:hypothetical protein
MLTALERVLARRDTLFSVGFWVLLIYFVVRAGYFALSTRWGVPPDENTHLALILQIASAKSFLGLENITPLTAQLGSSFFLYHWFLGTGLSVAQSVLELDERSVRLGLRGVNVLIATGTMLILRDLCVAILRRSAAALLVITVFSNVLMATFLAGSISYDNLVNFLSALAILLFIRYMRSRTATGFLSLSVVLLLGMLTKVSFFPLAGILLIGVVLVSWRDLQGAAVTLVGFKLPALPRRSAANVIIAAVFSIVSLGACSIWVSNRVEHNSFLPACEDRFSHEECFAKDPVYRKYSALREGNPERVARIAGQQLDPVRYIVVWFDFMVEKSVGIFAYKSFYQTPLMLGVMELLFAICLILAVRYAAHHREHAALLGIAGLYLMFIAFFVNYKFYLESGLLVRYDFVGIQGRYAFPVLAALLIPMGGAVTSISSTTIRRALVSCIVTLSVFSDLPGFLMTPPESRWIRNQALQERHIDAVIISETMP